MIGEQYNNGEMDELKDNCVATMLKLSTNNSLYQNVSSLLTPQQIFTLADAQIPL